MAGLMFGTVLQTRNEDIYLFQILQPFYHAQAKTEVSDFTRILEARVYGFVYGAI